ncbi:hypothetical protein [Falsiroseomonas oryzae]|uniref:hypothetical protein n=1 Tax=Falsiroseomonas oryzae TaxID=2766473 RepID=UPI0022EB2ADB|nr:hypothetical protein [Roseomonas sp. MO-31]
MVKGLRTKLIRAGALRGALHNAEAEHDAAANPHDRAAAAAHAMALRDRLALAEMDLPAFARRKPTEAPR